MCSTNKLLLMIIITMLVPFIEHYMLGIILRIFCTICFQSSKQTYDMKINILQKTKLELVEDFPDLTISKDCALNL